MPANVGDIADAYNLGRTTYRPWRKVPTQTTASGIWFDLSMSPGNPVPQYYAASPLVSTALARSTDGGLDHGGNVSPKIKSLHKMMALTVTATAAPLPMIVCDYLMYYPFVAMDTGPQPMTNSITVPRYTTGAGVQMMAIEVAGQVGGSRFFVTYTNQDGVAGRVTPTMTCNTQTVNGTVITSAPTTLGCAGPFIPLQSGDTGVRSIESCEFISSDVGLITLVLVKPLMSFAINDITAPCEIDLVIDRGGLCPRIYDDAYLNILAHPVGTLAAAPIIGEIHTYWSA